MLQSLTMILAILVSPQHLGSLVILLLIKWHADGAGILLLS